MPLPMHNETTLLFYLLFEQLCHGNTPVFPMQASKQDGLFACGGCSSGFLQQLVDQFGVLLLEKRNDSGIGAGNVSEQWSYPWIGKTSAIHHEHVWISNVQMRGSIAIGKRVNTNPLSFHCFESQYFGQFIEHERRTHVDLKVVIAIIRAHHLQHPPKGDTRCIGNYLQ